MANNQHSREMRGQFPTLQWGLLGPEHLAGSRRTRTLGLGAAVRKFNQLAVPGLGGVWFAKQIYLATLGVLIADRLRSEDDNVKAIEIANAIEALACWCAFSSNGWKSDARLRGRRKLSGKDDLTFTQLRQPRFYVTQPMRMATVETLVDLGFVKSGSQRFNSFRCTEKGKELVKKATSKYKPYNCTVEDYLLKRIRDDGSISNTPELRDALSPLVGLQDEALDLIRNRIKEDAGRCPEAARRKNALEWVNSLDVKKPAGWEAKPDKLDVHHWDDLRLGALFFKARDAAIEVLNAIEAAMAPLAVPKLTADAAHKLSPVQTTLKELRKAAKKFLNESDDPTEGHMATIFCRECTEEDSSAIIRYLVQRDDRVLRMVGNDILPGAAFSVQPQAETSDEEDEGPGAGNVGRIPTPDGISERIRNLYLLNLDLQEQLGNFLKQSMPNEVA